MAPHFTKLQKVRLALAILSSCQEDSKVKKRKWTKRCLMERPILTHTVLMDFDDISNVLKMEKENFYELLKMVQPFLSNSNSRQTASVEERLVVTLRYLATGTYFRDLRHRSIVSLKMLSKIIPETCQAISWALKSYLKFPSTEEEWKTTAQQFETHWQFSNCVGCIGARHILIRKPASSCYKYHNYKRTFSVVVFAVVNANYEFIFVEVGLEGSLPDGEVFKYTLFGQKLIDDELPLPQSYLLPSTDILVPYVFLTDNTIALDTNVMKPFPEKDITREQKIFNYRLCRARNVSENAFGILGTRFRALSHTMNFNPDSVNTIVISCFALHNFLKNKSKSYMTDTSIDREDIEKGLFINGTWHQDSAQLIPLEENHQPPWNDGEEVRNTLTEYFDGPGVVSFQEKMVNAMYNTSVI